MEAVVEAHTDFSGGQINGSARRSDDPLVKLAGLQMGNFRVEAQGTIVPRPGRRVLYTANATRTDFFRMSLGVTAQISFPPGEIIITDTSGFVIASSIDPSYLWDNSTSYQISATQAGNDIVLCFPGMRPVFCRWDPTTNTWAFIPFSFRVIAGIIQEPFFRINVPGASMTWQTATSAYKTVGATLPISCTVPYFTNAMIGTRLSILGGQVTIAAVIDSQNATAVVNSRLPDSVVLTPADLSPFLIGQVVETTLTGYEFEIAGLSTAITGPLMNGMVFTVPTFTTPPGDTVSSEIGTTVYTAANLGLSTGGSGTVQWQEEFMGALAGWPASCFYAKSRLGFCDFPQKPEAILWSSIGVDDVFYVDATASGTNPSAGASATSAILEFIDSKVRVRHVVDWGDLFAFSDLGIFQIPVSGTNPLKPGSVEFRKFSSDGCAGIRPITTLDAIVFVNAGLSRVGVVRATGSYTRPYVSDDLSELHSDLFVSPVCLAIATGDGPDPERYIYLANANGSAVQGRFSPKKQVGSWVPITGAGLVTWIIAQGGSVFFNATYGGTSMMEFEDAAWLLDGAVLINSPPANAGLPGKGPLWWLAGATATLTDGGLDLGDRAIDANGNIVPLQGEDLTSPTIQGGAAFTCTYQPVIGEVQGGQSRMQRMRRRKVKRAAVTVDANCPFEWGNRDIPAYQWGDDPTLPAPIRTGTYLHRQLGRSYDPVVVLKRQRPGLLRISECTTEVTI